MNIEMVSIGKIKPYENNPRNISDEAVEKISNSIKQFGFLQPIVVDKDYIIIVGHARHKGAKKLKLKKVPIVIADGLSADKVKAYRLADNKTNELTNWDDDKLFMEIGELKDKIDMSGFGFDTDTDIDIDEINSYFEEDVNFKGNKNGKEVKCPECGHSFEI